MEYCTDACTLRNHVVCEKAGTLSAAAWQGESISFRSGFAGSKAVKPVAKYLRMPICMRLVFSESRRLIGKSTAAKGRIGQTECG